MKRNATLLLLSTFLLTITLLSCRRRCVPADGAGIQLWLGKTQIIAPSAFTPANEDGINDTFGFVMVTEAPVSGTPPQVTAQKIKDFGMEIRRGGMLLNEAHGWGSTWNGKTSAGKRVEGLVDVAYSISDTDGNVSEGTFKLFVVPPGCLQECMHSHVFGDMIDPYQGAVLPTHETFCQ